MPIDAGQTKDVKLKVTPPNTAAAGNYKVVGARRGRRRFGDRRSRPRHHRPAASSTSAAARAWFRRAPRRARRPRCRSSSPIPARRRPTTVELSGSAPSGWKVTFDPKTIDRIAPNDNKEVQALITPTEKAIAGDYVTTIRASARGESASSTFRVTVTTSTMWGIAGVGIIGVALLVMVGAVARFGRR